MFITVTADETSTFGSLNQLSSLIDVKLGASPLAGLVDAGTTVSGGPTYFTLSSTANGATLTLRVRQFGVYVGDGGELRGDNGDLDGDGLNDSNSTTSARCLPSRASI